MSENLNDSELNSEDTSTQEKEVGGLALVLSNRYGIIVHVFLYLSVTGLLSLLWGITAIQGANIPFWPLHTIFGWGIAIGIHLLTYLMYNNIVKPLGKIKTQSDFGVLFVYHAFLYGIINAYLLYLNLLYLPEVLWVFWPLSLWGIGFGLHLLGVLNWNSVFNNELKKLQAKYSDEQYRLDFPEKKLIKMANKKISHFWFLLAHICYYVVITTLLLSSGLPNVYEIYFQWGLIVGLHLFGYLLAYNIESIKATIKGLLFNIATFGIALIVGTYQVIQEDLTINWIVYLIILWAIIIGIHAIVVKIWDSVKAKSFEKVSHISTSEGFDLENFEMESRAASLLIWQWSFIAHLLVYGVGLLLINIEITNAGLDPMLLLHPAMGWLVAVAIHAAIYISVRIQMLEFWPISALIHLAVYIVVSIYMIVLNILYSPDIPWSIIAMAGWGIGLGLHVLLAFLTRRP